MEETDDQRDRLSDIETELVREREKWRQTYRKTLSLRA